MSKRPPIGSDSLMIGITRKNDPVWRNHKKQLYVFADGKLSRLRWWKPSRWRFRKLPEPWLNYDQVATAQHKSSIVLKALRDGPMFAKRGLLYDRANRVVTTTHMTAILLHWMEGCGFVFVRTPINKNTTRVDIDLEASVANGVLGHKAK